MFGTAVVSLEVLLGNDEYASAPRLGNFFGHSAVCQWYAFEGRSGV